MSHPAQDSLKKQRKPIANRSSKASENTSSLTATAVQRAYQNPTSLSTQDVLSLQRTLGNQAVNGLVRSQSTSSPVPTIQAKLQVGPVHDRFEEEADRVAGGVAQHQPASAAFAAQGGTAPTTVEQGIRAARGGGSALPAPIRRSMEGTLNTGLDAVRIHTDARADTLNRAISARAFTTGQDIFFKKDEYRPGSSDGRSLLAHELTHVVQQSSDTRRQRAQRTPHIQRFSENDTKPGAQTNWDGETTAITKSSAGQVGGVFFAKDAHDNQLVLKPEYADNDLRPTTAAQSQFADKVLGQFGFATPGSRIVRNSDPEFQQIIQIVNSGRLQLKETDEPQRAAIGERLAGAKYIKVMTSIQGISWGDMTDEAAFSQEKAGEFLQLLAANNYALPHNMGKLIVADAVIGNDDRINFNTTFKKFGMNTGNIMFSGTKMFLIDSDAAIGQVSKMIGAKTGAFKTAKENYDIINNLFDHVDQYASTFAEKHVADLLTQARSNNLNSGKIQNNFDIRTVFDPWLQEHKDGIKAAVKAGMQDGLWQLSVLRSDKQGMQELHQEARTYGEGEEEELWTTFKARGRYLEDRDKGMDKELAINQNQLYFESKLGIDQESQVPEVEGVDPVALNIEAPKKRSKLKKFSLARRFGKRNKSRKQKKRVRDALSNETNLKKLSVLKEDRQVKPLDQAGSIINHDALKTDRTDRSAREVTFLQNSSVLVYELQKKGAEVRRQNETLNGLVMYLRYAQGRSTRETEAARKRIMGLTSSGNLTKLEMQTQQLEASVARAIPRLTKHNPELAQMLKTYVDELRASMDELTQTFQRAWEQVNAMEVPD